MNEAREKKICPRSVRPLTAIRRSSAGVYLRSCRYIGIPCNILITHVHLNDHDFYSASRYTRIYRVTRLTQVVCVLIGAYAYNVGRTTRRTLSSFSPRFLDRHKKHTIVEYKNETKCVVGKHLSVKPRPDCTAKATKVHCLHIRCWLRSDLGTFALYTVQTRSEFVVIVRVWRNPWLVFASFARIHYWNN